MAKLNWPPEQTFKYEFKDIEKLTLSITYEEDKKKAKRKTSEESDRAI